eukprot:2545817-Prymnesium_polylepis.1
MHATRLTTLHTLGAMSRTCRTRADPRSAPDMTARRGAGAAHAWPGKAGREMVARRAHWMQQHRPPSHTWRAQTQDRLEGRARARRKHDPREQLGGGRCPTSGGSGPLSAPRSARARRVSVGAAPHRP